MWIVVSGDLRGQGGLLSETRSGLAMWVSDTGKHSEIFFDVLWDKLYGVSVKEADRL